MPRLGLAWLPTRLCGTRGLTWALGIGVSNPISWQPQSFISMSLDLLHSGISVPEYSVTVPWLISQPELFRYIPESQFRDVFDLSATLSFTCLGVFAEFAFRFHPALDSRLFHIEMCNIDAPSHSFSLEYLTSRVTECLGPPNDRSRTGARWYDDSLFIVTVTSKLRRKPESRQWLPYGSLLVRKATEWPTYDHYLRLGDPPPPFGNVQF